MIETKIPSNDYHAGIFISNRCRNFDIPCIIILYPFPFIRRVLRTTTIKFMARESNETKVRSPVIKSSVLPRFFQSSPSIEHKWRISPSSPADYNRRDRSVIATFHHRVDRSVVHHSLDWSRDLRFRRANNGEKKGGRQCGKISRDETRMIKGGESAVTKHLREISPTGACVNSHRAISAEFDLVARRMVIIFSRILIEFSFNHLRFTFILHI